MIKALAIALIASAACGKRVSPAGTASGVTLTEQVSGTTALLVAVSAVNDDVAWIAGTNRTFLRTIDGGATWRSGQVPVAAEGDASNLQFRDIYAVDSSIAYLLSIGNGAASRVFKTSDGGKRWTQLFVNTDSSLFYDCFDFWSPTRGLMVSDGLVARATANGENWLPVASEPLLPPIADEGSFAASGTCVITREPGLAWIATTKGRVLRTHDNGRSWSAARVPITLSDSTGVVSVAFRDARNGIAFGGYGARPRDTLLAITRDGGATWIAGGNAGLAIRPPIRGGISGGAYVPGTRAVVVVGHTGIAYSPDEGRAGSWIQLDTANYWGLALASRRAGWIVGRRGRIARISGF